MAGMTAREIGRTASKIARIGEVVFIGSFGFRVVVFIKGKSGHQVTQGRFGALVEVHLVFFQSIVTAASAGVVDDLVQVIVAQKPIERALHFLQIIFVVECRIKFTEGKNGVGYVDGLFSVYGGFLTFE